VGCTTGFSWVDSLKGKVMGHGDGALHLRVRAQCEVYVPTGIFYEASITMQRIVT